MCDECAPDKSFPFLSFVVLPVAAHQEHAIFHTKMGGGAGFSLRWHFSQRPRQGRGVAATTTSPSTHLGLGVSTVSAVLGTRHSAGSSSARSCLLWAESTHLPSDLRSVARSGQGRVGRAWALEPGVVTVLALTVFSWVACTLSTKLSEPQFPRVEGGTDNT